MDRAVSSIIAYFLTCLYLRVNVIGLAKWLHTAFSVLLFTQHQRQQISICVIGVGDRTNRELAQLAVL